MAVIIQELSIKTNIINNGLCNDNQSKIIKLLIEDIDKIKHNINALNETINEKDIYQR